MPWINSLTEGLTVKDFRPPASYHRPWKVGSSGNRPRSSSPVAIPFTKGDADERSLAARLENHARGALAIDEVVDAEFDRTAKPGDIACHHAHAWRRQRAPAPGLGR